VKKAHSVRRQLSARHGLWDHTYGLMDASLPSVLQEFGCFRRELGVHAIEHYYSRAENSLADNMA